MKQFPETDTHAWVVPQSNADYADLIVDGTGFSEAGKSSNHNNITFTRCVFIGGHEDAFDIVRGYNITFNKCKFVANGDNGLTIKGGVQNVVFNNCTFEGSPKNAHIVLGQYCDYDFCRRKKTTGIVFNSCRWVGSRLGIEVWDGEMPSFNLCYTRVNKIPYLIVEGYFLFRKIHDRIKFGKNGRNDACSK